MRTFVILMLWVFGTASHAGTISQFYENAGDNIYTTYPVGQSFTAEMSDAVFAFFLREIGSSTSTDPVTFSLYEGMGYTGTLLVSETRILSSGDEFKEFDLSSVSLGLGQIYTAQITSPDADGWSLRRANYRGFDAYKGGVYHFGDGVRPFNDAKFYVRPVDELAPEEPLLLPAAVPNVPLPAGVWLLIAGLGGFGLLRRNRRTYSQHCFSSDDRKRRGRNALAV